jgi:hypothetical protein
LRAAFSRGHGRRAGGRHVTTESLRIASTAVIAASRDSASRDLERALELASALRE